MLNNSWSYFMIYMVLRETWTPDWNSNTQVLVSCDPLIVLTGAHCVVGSQVLIFCKNWYLIICLQSNREELYWITNVCFCSSVILNVSLTKEMSTFVTLTKKMSIFAGSRSSPWFWFKFSLSLLSTTDGHAWGNKCDLGTKIRTG